MQVIYAFIFLGPYYVCVPIFNKYVQETAKNSKCSQCIANQLPKGAKEDKTDKTTNPKFEAAKTKKTH